MKKFFTLFVALVCSTIIYAQTPANDVTNSTFKGTVSATALGKTMTDENQQVDFKLSDSGNAVDMTLSSCSFSGKAFTTDFKITLKETTVKGFNASKNGSVYSLTSNPFDLTIYNIDDNPADVKGQITASSIDMDGKKATLTLTLTSLPSAMALIGKSLDVKYNLTLETFVPTNIEGVNLNPQTPNHKYVNNGKVVILNDGVEYSVNGAKL